MKNLILPLFAFLFLLQGTFAHQAEAVSCAKVSIEILQQLTVERVAFDARMVITNGIPDQPLENVRVDVVVRDSGGNVKNELFFVRPPVLTGFSGTLDGSGSVAASSRGESHWLIVPAPGAGFIEQDGALKQVGVDYWVGATLSYTVNGQTEIVAINPAKITVKPMPQLVLDYFMPYSVLGDNPFTSQVESPVPYPLALRVLNDGYGEASRLKIDSAQPKIVDNRQGLLIGFRILGTSINDSGVLPSLTVNFGDLPSKKAATASWQMISTLSGRFVDFKTTFSHSSELGGELTSLIRQVTPHYLTHMVKVNLPGRDSRLDFLAEMTDEGGTIFESEIPNGSTRLADASTPVKVVLPVAAPSRPTAESPTVSLNLASGTALGWIYTKLPDPSQGLQRLTDVVRADGVHLDPNNFWVDQGLDADYKKIWTLQFIDYRADATTPGAYSLVFSRPDVDTTAPASSLVFDGPSTGTNPFYIMPQTRVVMTSADNEGGSGVDAMFKKVAGSDSDFLPAYPFNLTVPGSYTAEYYSTDLAGNVEESKSATIVVIDAAPTISTFSAAPASFAPQAPKGVAASRSATLKVKASSAAATLPVEIAIASGSSFQQANVVRTLKGSTAPGAELSLVWDGKDGAGNFLPIGSYTARVKVSDGLDSSAYPDAPSHTVTADTALTVADWFAAAPVDPNPAADQQHPRLSGSTVVWQDLRNGRWDIYLKNLSSGASQIIPSRSPRRERPAIDGNTVVWQDYRNGNWDIYGYNLSSGDEFSVSTEAGDQTRPVIAGTWVAWQDSRSGNADIYAYNLSTGETVRITSHERDQIQPAISGAIVTWEDYRNGPADIYQYDLAVRSETRRTTDPANQGAPAVSANAAVWIDQRNGQKDIYSFEPGRGELRVTYGTADHGDPSLSNGLLVYTDFEGGSDDPNLSFRLLAGGNGGRLTADPARQEEPSLGEGNVVWQDNRDGRYQIYAAPLATEALPVEFQLKPGFNLAAVGAALATAYPSASDLLADADLGIEKILSHDPLHNTYIEASAAGGDFTLVKGAALTIYSSKGGAITLAESGETGSYTLLAGANQIGILTVPYGYSAYDLMRSVGLEHIQSVRRFDSTIGAWQSVAVRPAGGGAELVGLNFMIYPGDGLILTMKNRVDGWTP